ncbi:hypothetical protein K493DRAFT_44530 [Basidiobolus meristosporus CBS 931.73]|uniref:Uncharacterized protein n=1 Tax=Basidiobolus meristosporus CBS 931.73 TaxID=1314790 RepID=A0A1Y1Y2V2_9FUNG|nr:hypothetical protein K493DRAFT_44530 [Basidiobolus meristosporus CBS 931.73]|eukprot:ORX92309.1 hypothetical protein K493DRAFT_44530 [Basidiobolus meristosporus CBS 931.73]
MVSEPKHTTSEKPRPLHVSIPPRPKRPHYVSFVSPEFLSPQLERKRKILYRTPLLLLRILTISLSSVILHQVHQLLPKIQNKGELYALLSIGIVSIVANSVCILNWVWTQVRCQSRQMLLESPAVDLEQTEESPLVYHMTRRRSRKWLLFYFHLIICVAWSCVGIKLLGTNWRCPISTHSLDPQCKTPWMLIHLSFGSTLSWLLGLVLIWMDLQRCVF